jgi:CBS domain-containing protein
MATSDLPRHVSPLAGTTAGAVMRPGVLTAAADASMRSVAQVMAANAVHAVLVPADEPEGRGWPSVVVSDLDLVRTAIEGDLDRVTAGQAGSERSVLVDVGDELDRVARHMAATGRDHLLVAGRWSRLPEGIISAYDVVAVIAGRDPHVARLVRPHPARPAISERRLDRVAVRDAMHAGVVACPPDTDLRTFSAALADHRVHAVVVGDLARRGHAGEHVVSRIVEAMDIVRAAAEWDPLLTATGLGAVDRATIGPDATMLEAARAMVDRSVGHLVVADGAARPLGVVSTLDVATICATT